MNDSKQKVKLSQERNFSAHHMLLGAARLALKDVKDQRPGWFYSELTAITFCGLALEAIANTFGENFVENWDDFEKSSPIAKLRVICQTLDVEYDSSKEPWGMAKWIVKFRNGIAHAKFEVIKKDQILDIDEFDDRKRHPPKSKLEEKISPENADKSYKAVKEILDIFCDAIPAEKKFGITSDAWSGRSQLHNEDKGK